MPTTRETLRLVSEDDTPPAKSWQNNDTIFFHKSQITLGTILVFFGRTDHGSLWRVSEIKSFGESRTKRRTTAERLSDTIVLQRIGSNSQWTQASFAYLSYSSVWRLSHALVS